MSDQTQRVINLRLFVEVSTEDEAWTVGERLSKALDAFGSHKICRLKPYWKIPEYFELCVEISGPDLSEDQTREISILLGKDWVIAGGH